MLSINRYTFLCIFLFFFSLHLIAQDDQVYSNLEDLSEGLDIQMDFSELFEERASLRDHPINLNSNHIDRLQQLLLLQFLLQLALLFPQ